MSNKIRSMEKARERKQAKEGLSTTLFEILQSQQSLGVLISQPIPIRTSFQLGKLVRSINLELEQYQASRKELCERLAEKDADGKPKMIPATENQAEHYDIKDTAEFEKEHLELVGVEITLPGAKIRVSELGSVNIAPAHLLSLDWLLTD